LYAVAPLKATAAADAAAAVAAAATATDGSTVGYQTKPLVIGDFSDNPGAGSYGDATNLLLALLEGGCTNDNFNLNPQTCCCFVFCWKVGVHQ
jgi:microcystin degradation protein MlrC